MSTARDAVIVAAVRTPIGKRKGALADVHPAELSAHVLQRLLDQVELDAVDIDDVVWGCVNQIGDQAGNIARTAVLSAGWPDSVPGTTVDRRCGSGQQAIHFASAGVVAGHYDIVVAGGVESMTRVPMGSAGATGQPHPDGVLRQYRVAEFNQGTSAELVARHWNLSRSQLDEYALRSHERCVAAMDSGVIAAQLASLRALTADEGVRRGCSIDTLSTLRPAFADDGLVTAGNASQISDGAAALLITTTAVARLRGWQPLARLHTAVVVGSDPVMMLTGPIAATELALRRSGLALTDIGAFEVNEAFACVPLAWQAETGVPDARMNPLGGAIATGHPLGGSGAVLMTRLVHHMLQNGIDYGLQTMCEAGGLANATVLQLV